jgi:hypothetical protein
VRSSEAEIEIPVLKCFHCDGSSMRCTSCCGTGEVFYVYGRTLPYTEEGYRRARICWKAESKKMTDDPLNRTPLS